MTDGEALSALDGVHEIEGVAAFEVGWVAVAEEVDLCTNSKYIVSKASDRKATKEYTRRDRLSINVL